MKKNFVRTQNVKNFISLMNSLQNKPEGVPKMALVFGDPGLGKSQTALWWAVKNDSIYLRSSNMMSGRWFLEELVEELGETPYYRSSDLLKQAVNQLVSNPRPIIIDEIDYLLGDLRTIETIRDIYDRTNVPILLMGMNKADKKLSRYRHVYDRLSEILKFESFSLLEVKNIIEQLSEVEISDDAVNLIHSKANRFRQIVNLINKAEKLAQANSLSIIDSQILKTGTSDFVEVKDIRSKINERQNTQNSQRA